MKVWRRRINTSTTARSCHDDAGVGLYDYGARWYDAALGRWGQVDPLAEEYKPWSPFVYTMNNPIRYVDPDGRSVDDYIFVDFSGNELGRIIDPEVKAVVVVPDSKLDEFNRGKHVWSNEYKISLGVTYRLEGADELFSMSETSRADAYDADGRLQVADKDGKPRYDVSLEYGSNLELNSSGEVQVARDMVKQGSPHIHLKSPLRSQDVGDIHTHPNEAKGVIQLPKINAKLNASSSRGPSERDYKASAPRSGYFNMVVDDRSYYFYNDKKKIKVDKNKFQ
jgi:RHS repeat-associated protein